MSHDKGAPDIHAGFDEANAPVFVLGSHRCGGTLLRYILDSHSRLACPPESKFLPALKAFWDYPQVRPALNSLGFDTASTFRLIRKMAATIYHGFTSVEGKYRCVDRTPNHYRYLDFIDEVFLHKPKYVILSRHPIDCVLSLEKFFSLAGSNHADPEIARAAARYGAGRSMWIRYWKEVYDAIHLFAARHADRCKFFQYERLATAPIPTAEEILNFIGEQYEQGLIERALLQTHAKGFGDSKIKSTKQVHAGSVGTGNTLCRTEREELFAAAGPVAIRLGYAAEISRQNTASAAF